MGRSYRSAPTTAGAGGGHLFLDVLDLQSGLGAIVDEGGALANVAGIVLAEILVSDPGLRVGDPVTILHPRRAGPATCSFVDCGMITR